MRHVSPMKNFSVLMAALNDVIPPMLQTSFDPNTTLYLITSPAEINSLLRYFVSQCQRKAIVGFFQPASST